MVMLSEASELLIGIRRWSSSHSNALMIPVYSATLLVALSVKGFVASPNSLWIIFGYGFLCLFIMNA
jgi:hypothetical protein